MLFNTVFLAFVASAVTASALPSTAGSSKLDARDPQFNKPFNPFFRAPQRTPPKPVPAKSNNAAVKGGSSNSNKFNSKPAPNKFKARKPKKTPTKMWFQPGGVPRRQPQQNQNQFRGGKGRGGKGKNNNGGKGNNNNNNNNNNNASSTTTAADAAVTDPAQLDDGAAQDTGITDVVEFCLNGDGKTSCFEILGDSKDSCFTIPNPIANNAAFFLPPPKDTCELFTDVDCTSDPTPALGAIANVKQLAWSCTPTANATTTTTDAASTTTSANNAVATGGSDDNTAGDTGITNVIEGCLNPDGKTKCFEILADTLESCFTLPNPLANNVAFWLPMPNATCTLFSDEDCTKNAFPNANGPIDDVKRNSWSCVPA